jgi:hypothetical protein
MTETTKQTKLRDVPHAEIRATWLLDAELIVQFSHDNKTWGNLDEASWNEDVHYRLIREILTTKKYHIAYIAPSTNEWCVSYNAGYSSVEDFRIQNPSLSEVKAEIIEASAVQYEGLFEIVFTSPATE